MGWSQDEALFKALKELYIDETYSDLVVQSSNKQYNVHKAIVCPRSSFFTAACNGHFKEARTGVVQLPDDDPQAVEMMIHYFYHRDYPHISPYGGSRSDSPENSEPSHQFKSDLDVRSPASHSIEVVQFQDLGGQEEVVSEVLEDDLELPTTIRKKSKKDKKAAIRAGRASRASRAIESSLGIWGTQKATTSDPVSDELTSPRLSQLTETNLIIHARVYALAVKYDVHGLGPLAIEKFRSEVVAYWDTSDFLQAAEVAYNSTVDGVRGLRDIVVETFFDQPSLMEKDEGAQLVKDVEGLAYDLLRYVWERRM